MFKIGDHIIAHNTEGEIIAPPAPGTTLYTVHLWPGYQTTIPEKEITLDNRNIFHKGA